MIEKHIREQVIDLIRQEVVPAIGCTEPMCVALCTARAREALGTMPERVEVWLSANILKNAMGVGIPGTGMVGLPIAIALGALIGKSEYQLEVLKDLTPQALEEGKRYIGEKRVSIHLKEGIEERLYAEVSCYAAGHKATAIIAHSHTGVVFVEKDGKSLLDTRGTGVAEAREDGISLNMPLVYEFATTAPLEEIEFMIETKEVNLRAADEAIKGNYGHNLGKTIDRPLSQGIFGRSIFSHIIAKTASACDARMGGAMIPVMSNSGSGNQGICATNPVAVYAMENENTREELIRALTLSHLTAIYIKQSLGKLSALCGCVVASIGSSCGITYLMGGDYERVCRSVKNMIANLTGMICDGAKASCAGKIANSVEAGIIGYNMCKTGNNYQPGDGIVGKDVEETLANVGTLAKKGMEKTNEVIIDIMIKE